MRWHFNLALVCFIITVICFEAHSQLIIEPAPQPPIVPIPPPATIPEDILKKGRIIIEEFDKVGGDCYDTEEAGPRLRYTVRRPAGSLRIASIVINRLESSCAQKPGFCMPPPPDSSTSVHEIYRVVPEDDNRETDFVSSAEIYDMDALSYSLYAYVLVATDEEGRMWGSQRVPFRLPFIPDRSVDPRFFVGSYVIPRDRELLFSIISVTRGLPFEVTDMRLEQGPADSPMQSIPLGINVYDDYSGQNDIDVRMNQAACDLIRRADSAELYFRYSLQLGLGRCEGDTDVVHQLENPLTHPRDENAHTDQQFKDWCDTFLPPPPPPPVTELLWKVRCICQDPFAWAVVDINTCAVAPEDGPHLLGLALQCALLKTRIENITGYRTQCTLQQGSEKIVEGRQCPASPSAGYSEILCIGEYCQQ